MAEAVLQSNKGLDKAIVAGVLLLCNKMKGEELWNAG